MSAFQTNVPNAVMLVNNPLVMGPEDSDGYDMEDPKCFLCSHAFVMGEEPWLLFEKRLRDDGHVESSPATILASVLNNDNLDESKAHSKLLCDVCNAIILEYETVDHRWKDLRLQIVDSYEQTKKLLKKEEENNNNKTTVDTIPVEQLSPSQEYDEDADNFMSFLAGEGEIVEEYNSIEFAMLNDENDGTSQEAQPQMAYAGMFEVAQLENVKPEDQELDNSDEFKFQGYLADFDDLIEVIYETDGTQPMGCAESEDVLGETTKTEHVIWRCELCLEEFPTSSLLRSHKQDQHEDHEVYPCAKCDECFISGALLKEHLNVHSDSGLESFECDICQKQFLYKHNLKKHRRLHTNEKHFECEECGKTFRIKQSLDKHSVIHSGERPFMCDICGKSFSRKVDLNDHCRTHTGEKPFKCDSCPMAFAQRSNLTTHKKHTHLKLLAHKCEICQRAFKRKRLLEYHMNAVHRKERPYKCEKCTASFVYPEHFKKHSLIHAAVKPFSCEVCGKEFNSRDNRNTHRYTHSNKKPYECLTCGAGFMRKPLLLDHMRRVNHNGKAIIVNQPQIVEEGYGEDAQIAEALEASNNIMDLAATQGEDGYDSGAYENEEHDSGHLVTDGELDSDDEDQVILINNLDDEGNYTWGDLGQDGQQ